MKTGILYLNIGTRCLVRLAVSIYSLRQYYDGPICIINAAGHDGGIMERFTADSRLGVEVRHIGLPIYRKRTAYAAKPSVYHWTPFDRTMFIDADTAFRADPSPLLELDSPLTVTQFSDWNCGGSIVGKRVECFYGVECPPLDVPALARQVIAEKFPAINTGVFTFDNSETGRKQMQLWERLTQTARTKANFTDEIAAQILLPVFGDDAAMVDDSYNFSPIYGKSKSPIIIHSHGNKSCRSESLPYFWPVFLSSFELNIAGIRDWIKDTKEGRLREYLDSVGFRY